MPNPVPAIVEHTRNTGPGGEIMLITQSAFLRLPEFVRRHEWTVIIDEAPDPVWECTINLPETRERVFPILTELVDPVPHAALYFRLMPREGFLSALERMARNVQDDAAWKIFADAAARIASPHWDVYVIQSQYDAVLRGEAEQLTLFTVLRPTILMGFRTATVMSACFDDTLLARLWAGEVDFRPHRRITKRLRYHAHPNGHPLTIHYIFERDWSKNLREKRVNGVSALEYTAAEVTNLFGSEPFI